MRFKIIISTDTVNTLLIPINYQYPLSSAIYRIIAKGDRQYADFLHEKGYGKEYLTGGFLILQILKVF